MSYLTVRFLDCCDSDQCRISTLPPEFAESNWVKELMKKRLETQLSDLGRRRNALFVCVSIKYCQRQMQQPNLCKD